jgi:hypothetical protein
MVSLPTSYMDWHLDGFLARNLRKNALGWFFCQQVTRAGTGLFSLPVNYIGRHWDGLSSNKLHRQAPLGWFLSQKLHRQEL